MIQGKEYFFDDLGNKGGLTVGSKFIMMGDQNLDPIAGKLWKIIWLNYVRITKFIFKTCPLVLKYSRLKVHTVIINCR